MMGGNEDGRKGRFATGPWSRVTSKTVLLAGIPKSNVVRFTD